VVVGVVASSCRFQGCMGGVCSYSRLAHPSGISDPGRVGVALGGAMPFDYSGDPSVW
jgi:hypothetical protein